MKKVHNPYSIKKCRKHFLIAQIYLHLIVILPIVGGAEFAFFYENSVEVS